MSKGKEGKKKEGERAPKVTKRCLSGGEGSYACRVVEVGMETE